jgi:NADH-quinone oxidoreductase subunit A
MSTEYLDIALFLIFSFVLSMLLLGISFVITFDSKLDIEKSSAYECGFQPFSESRYRFSVQFYLIAILFLLFDIEILYLFPLAMSFLSLSYESIVYLLIFFSLLLSGLFYEISRGILNFRDNLA